MKGYAITATMFLPVDPDDLEATARAIEFIQRLPATLAEATSPPAPGITVKSRFVTRRQAVEAEADTDTAGDLDEDEGADNDTESE